MIEIDRQTIQIIDSMESSMSAFHGFRVLWAELVANHEPCGVTKEKLEQMQSDRLNLALGQAYVLARKHGLRWMGTSKERDFIQELADEPCTYGDNCPTFGSNHGKCISCRAREALKFEV